MAKELREGDGKAGIARAGKRKLGYDTAQVDAFLERAHALYDSEGINLTQQDIQSVSFDLAKDGYVISQVDAALNRLERAVVDKQTAWEIAQQGRVAWKAQTEKLYQEIASHVERAPRQRFKPGEPKHPSYDRKQVDRIADQVVDKAAAALGMDGVTQDDVRGLADLNASSVNNVIFTQRKGKKGYDERQVDYFLNICVQLLSRLESYARVGDYVSNTSAASDQESEAATVAATPAKDAVSPLISAEAQRTATAAAPTVAAVAAGESFDALRKAEQNLFPAAATSPVMVTPSAPAVSPAPVAYTPAATAAAPAVQPQPATASVAPVATPQPAPTAAAPSTPQAAAQPLPSFRPAGRPVSTAAEPTIPVTTLGIAPSTSSTPSAPSTPSVNKAAVPQPAATPAPGYSSTVSNDSSSSSLAALAHMAEISQEMPAVGTSSFTPKMPSLDTPSALKLNETPSPVHSADMPASFAPATQPAHTHADAASAASTPAADDNASTQVQPVQQPADTTKDADKSEDKESIPDTVFPMMPSFDSDFNISIPDLQFPTLNDDNTKKEQ